MRKSVSRALLLLVTVWHIAKNAGKLGQESLLLAIRYETEHRDILKIETRTRFTQTLLTFNNLSNILKISIIYVLSLFY